MQIEVFSLTWRGHLKFMNEAPNQAVPNWIALYPIMGSQTKA